MLFRDANPGVLTADSEILKVISNDLSKNAGAVGLGLMIDLAEIVSRLIDQQT